MFFEDKMVLETGLPRTLLVKEWKLLQFMSSFDNASLSLKIDYSLFGGTAINKAYLGKAQRFSEDFDIHVFGSFEKASMIIKSLGVKSVVGPSRIFKNFYRWELHYSDLESKVRDDCVNVDVMLLDKKLTETVRVKLHSFLEDADRRFSITASAFTYPAETLIALKLLALHSRAEGKDYYDLYYMLSSVDFDSSKVLREVHKYKASLFDFQRVGKDFFEECVSKVRSAEESKLVAADTYVLAEKRPDWHSLKRDLARLLKLKLSKSF